MENIESKTDKVLRMILVRFILVFLIFSLVFFLPTRTLNYWEAWIYIGMILVGASLVVSYFFRKDPNFLIRRMRTKEKVKEQKLIIKFGWVLLLPIFILPSFDNYYGWSDLPLYLVIISDIIVFLGYVFVLMVFKENSYALRVVEVESNQKVISTGPYAILRHPMYSGVLLMYVFTPLALGSFWALIGSIFFIIIIIVRIFSEEKYLKENLPGYSDYLKNVKYRLILGVW